MKFYALHKYVAQTGGRDSGVKKIVVEPVFSDEHLKPEIKQMNIGNVRYQIQTVYFDNMNDVEETIKTIYAGQAEMNERKMGYGTKLVEYPDAIYVENLTDEGLLNIPFTKEEIACYMHLYDYSYSMALLLLLETKKPEVLLEFFGSAYKIQAFKCNNRHRDYGYFNLHSNKANIFKVIADAFELPVEIFVLNDKDYFDIKPNLNRLIDLYEKINGKDIMAKFDKYDGEQKMYLYNRYIAVNCVAMVNKITPSSLATANGLTRQMMSKFLLDPNSPSVSDDFTKKVNSLLLELEPALKDYL